MSDPRPVVIYGASGYTGRLVAEFLREYSIPFVAAGRNKAKLQEVMNSVPGIETADYEIAAVDGSPASLEALFNGRKVVCNMVGPFLRYAPPVLAAALNAGCHYLDTAGEQHGFVDREPRRRRGRQSSPRTGQIHAKVIPHIADEIANEAKRRGVQQGVVIEDAWALYRAKNG